MARERIHFVTGRLAEFSLREVLAELAPAVGFDYTVDVLHITVAALMTTDWIAKRIEVPPGTNRVIVPGYCRGELSVIAERAGCAAELGGYTVERGPRDLRRLPEHFGRKRRPADYGAYDIQILAEINHAPALSLDEVLRQAAAFQAQGADLIDLGCEPGEPWAQVGEYTKALRDAGHRVSIDSMQPREIAAAVAAGAELVLSVNSANREAAPDWGCEVVVVPDVPATMAGMDETVEFLAAAGVRLRIDPVLEPIGFGFAESLGRYLDVRHRYPDAEMMMGIGNLTELTDADSAPINVLLLGFCQELGIHSVLTTAVINWARTSVQECDLARRLVHHAVQRRTLPKHVEPRLVMLRDPKVVGFGAENLDRLAERVTDTNYRIFAEAGELHAITAGQHHSGNDPFEIFELLQAAAPKPLDPGHAFYLGYEMAKALTALTLGKEYRQDEALDWGMLTVREESHRLKRKRTTGPDKLADEMPEESAE